MNATLCSPAPKIIQALDRFLSKPLDYPWLLLEKAGGEKILANDKKLKCNLNKKKNVMVKFVQAALTVSGPWGEEVTTCLMGQCPDCKYIYWCMDTKYAELYKKDTYYHSLWN